jgi:RNA polymerase sigma-70 factor (ECF subfamily)
MSANPQRSPALTDPEVIARVLEGEVDAYETIVRRYEAALYRHACGMGLDHDTSLDLVQDAFVKAYQRLSDCRDRARFRSWLFRIARNLCFDHFRRTRQIALPLSQVPEADAVPDHWSDPLDRSMVTQALERLSPVLREAFLLKHDAGYTYEEIAEITGAGPSAVKMRVHRARIELCEYFDESPKGDERTSAPVYHLKAMNHESRAAEWLSAQPRRSE